MEFISNNLKTNIQIKTYEPPKKYKYNLTNPITSDNVRDYIYNKVLWIGKNFENTINIGDNNQIEIIYFDGDCYFNSSLNSLPSTLKHLEFAQSCIFSEPINNLPQGLKTLILGYNFDEYVDNLPDSLEDLTLGESFNNPVDNLPSGLKSLSLGLLFNQSVANLPLGLKKLILSNCFDKTLINLPPNLIYLQFVNNNNWIGNLNNLPDSIQFLLLDLNLFDYFKEPVLNNLPKSIKYLEIITKQKLFFESNFNDDKKLLVLESIIEKEHGNFLNKYNLIFI